MSPELTYLIPTQFPIKDERGGLYSLVGTFWDIRVPEENGFYYQSFSVVGRLSGIEEGNHTIEVTIRGPEGESFASRKVSGYLESGTVVFEPRFDLVKFVTSGTYAIGVSHNGVLLDDGGRYFITVRSGKMSA